MDLKELITEGESFLMSVRRTSLEIISQIVKAMQNGEQSL